MKPAEAARRITGFSTPLFGVSWEPGEADAAAARRVMEFLADRRVLWRSIDLEVPSYSIEFVLEIRRYLTEELQRHGQEDELANLLRQLRAACRRFIEAVDPVMHRSGWHNWFDMLELDRWEVGDAFGALRATFGQGIAVLSSRWGFDVPDELEAILPAAPSEDDDEDHDRRSRRRRRPN
ncbi:MAG: DUF6650 family protein [Gammaproteobacteria bacterium]